VWSEFKILNVLFSFPSGGLIPQRRRHSPVGTHLIVEDGSQAEQGEKLISSSSSSSISNGDNRSLNPNAIDLHNDSD